MTITYPNLGGAGRLGNQLWEIASTIGIAESLATEFSFPPWKYQHVFSLDDMFFDGRQGEDAVSIAGGYLGPQGKYYLQDIALWEKCELLIRKVFTPSIGASQYMRTHLDEMQHLPRPWNCVHVRRGDNATAHLRNEQGHHPLRPMSYYDQAIDMLPEGSLIVFSDDLKWCRKNFKADWFFEGGPPRPKEHEAAYATAPALDWIDLLGMTYCDNHIISNSTYSWWGAFLANAGQVIYPWPWFGPKLQDLNAGLMFEGLDWTRLEHE